MGGGKYVDFGGENPNEMWVIDCQEEPKAIRVRLSNLVAGDTDSGYFKLPESAANLNLDEIVPICDDIAYKVNAEYPDFLKKAFNIPDSRLDSMVSNREVVSDKSFFVTKKRYAMHIVDDEGKRVDKTKIMGLEVKKADTSKSLKEFLRKMIDMILDDCTREDLIKAKKEYKKEFFTQSIQEIGVPMPSNKLKQYQDRLKEFGTQKGFPYHYRAALFYNSLCGPMDKEIFAGERFYVCNVKSLDTKYIACPVDLNEVPDIVTSIPIDYKSMWTKAEKKINNYMKSLGWDLESMMEQKNRDWFGL